MCLGHSVSPWFQNTSLSKPNSTSQSALLKHYLTNFYVRFKDQMIKRDS